VAWDTANEAVPAEGRRVRIDDPTRFDGVSVIGVDEHVWRRTRRGDTYVTVMIDLTGIRDGTGPARLLDMVEVSRPGFGADLLRWEGGRHVEEIRSGGSGEGSSSGAGAPGGLRQ
jgi:hypothetical protein